MQCVYLILSLLFLQTYSKEVQLDKLRIERDIRCVGDEFGCKNGQCIASDAVCDGEKNCDDGSDETQAVCSKLNLQCPSFAFRCAYGACIDKKKKCDGRRDCADNSDELLPECKNAVHRLDDGTCKDGEFKCLSGQCIDEFSVCDGSRDCDDGTDETITQCVNIRCPDFSFQCAYGACIDKNKRCNNVDDCSDASDEDEELCQSTKKPIKPPVIPRPTPPTDVQRRGCILPDYPDGGQYSIKACNNGNKCNGGPGTVVPLNSVISFQCRKGYILSETARNYLCFNGVWDPELPTCLKQCKPLISDSMNLECLYKGEPVRCDRPLNPGTKVKPQCKTGYRPQDRSTTFIETECLPDGTLEVQLFRCIPGKEPPSSPTNPTTMRPLILYILNVIYVLPKQANNNSSNDFSPWEIQQERYESNLV
ncbi:hypothetical protein O3M35_013106 [Rhynocoris fuscipes]|uniref:Sushi domain-containing protein n=1 Tax=Rhynocoris fuscipes TaxID=488301 RepID=A0AAW1CES7_9HEMI